MKAIEIKNKYRNHTKIFERNDRFQKHLYIYSDIYTITILIL